MWRKGVKSKGFAIYGSPLFTTAVVDAINCLHNSKAAQQCPDALRGRIFQRGAIAFFRIPRHRDLLISRKCLSVKPPYLSCLILFMSTFKKLTASGADSLAAGIKSLEVQIVLAEELDLELDYVENLKLNLYALTNGCIPRQLLKHPAF